jgi:hypothetical protein
MIDLALDNIHECNNAKETLILKLKVMEESRIELIQEIAESHRLAPPVTLAQIIGVEALQDQKRTLEACRSNLISLINGVREVLQINAVLAERSINYTRDSLSFLNRLTLTMPVYLSNGRIDESSRRGKPLSKKG